MARIDTKKLIAHFGGRTACHNLLVKAGHNVTKKALEKWQERGQIPLMRLLQLIDADRQFNGRELKIEDFVAHE